MLLNSEADGAAHSVPLEPNGQAAEADPQGALAAFLVCFGFVCLVEWQNTGLKLLHIAS